MIGAGGLPMIDRYRGRIAIPVRPQSRTVVAFLVASITVKSCLGPLL
jgi:hypothetical protein